MKIHKAIITFVLSLTTLISVAAVRQETATQLMVRCCNAYKSARSLQATFSMSGVLGNTSGMFCSSGSKYSFITGDFSTWYNGKTIWSYNPRTNETSIFTPDTEEIAQNNPFSIITSMASNFRATYAKQQPVGTKVLVLIPQSVKSQIKKVVLTLDAKRCTPRKIVLTDSSGTTTITVSKFSANINIPSLTFSYPQNKYPKAKIIDLR